MASEAGVEVSVCRMVRGGRGRSKGGRGGVRGGGDGGVGRKGRGGS